HPSPGATADVEAWERLWARSRLVLHAEGQVLTSSLSAPCDLPAELVPCWQPEPDGPCQSLPGLQQPAVGQQGPQEFGGLRLHPNLCVQVWSSRQVRLTQCLRDSEYCRAGGQRQPGDQAGGCPSLTSLRRPPPPSAVTSPGALPGHADDLLLLQHGGNASLCALERGTCTPLASFTSTVRGRDPCVPVTVVLVAQPGHPLPLLQGAGRPGLLERELRRDVVAGHCRQIRHPENGTGVTLWACPLHKYLRARWALAWMGMLLGAACLLLLLLLTKENVKG
ncbi:I17RC protein, partial [Phaetusa simplex]|nr:I17RC protein [Phaetusa simplex]